MSHAAAERVRLLFTALSGLAVKASQLVYTVQVSYSVCRTPDIMRLTGQEFDFGPF